MRKSNKIKREINCDIIIQNISGVDLDIATEDKLNKIIIYIKRRTKENE